MKTSHLPDSIGNTTISRLFSFHTTHLFPFFFFFFHSSMRKLRLRSRLFFSSPHSCATPRVFFARICKTWQLFTTYRSRSFFPIPFIVFRTSSSLPFLPFFLSFFPPQFNRRTLPIPASTRYIIRYSGREPGRPIAAPSDPFAPLFLWVGDDETLLNIYTFSLTFYLDIKRDEY